MQFTARLWQIEDAVDRLKRSAKAYDEALAKDAAGPSGARLARVQALMFDIDQTFAPNVGPAHLPLAQLSHSVTRDEVFGSDRRPPATRERWAVRLSPAIHGLLQSSRMICTGI